MRSKLEEYTKKFKETGIQLTLKDSEIASTIYGLYSKSQEAPECQFLDVDFWSNSELDLRTAVSNKLVGTRQGFLLELFMVLAHLNRTQILKEEAFKNGHFPSKEKWGGAVNLREFPVTFLLEVINLSFLNLNLDFYLDLFWMYLLDMFGYKNFTEKVLCHVSYWKDGKIEDKNMCIPQEEFSHELLLSSLGAQAIIVVTPMTELQFKQWVKPCEKKPELVKHESYEDENKPKKKAYQATFFGNSDGKGECLGVKEIPVD